MTSFAFTDSHCHLDFDELTQQGQSLLTQCFDAGIKRIIVPAVSPKNWKPVLDLSKSSSKHTPIILPCLGIHPWYLQGLTYQNLDQLKTAVSQNHTEIVAIGETGIDGKIAKEQTNLAKQITFFREHIHLANQFKLPLIVHHRSSHPIIYQELKNMSAEAGGIIHSFSGSYQQACQYIDLGFKLGIGGTISYERAKKTINTVKKLPLDSIVLETDAPSMPLSGYQGEANSPLKLINIFQLLCQLRSESPEKIAQTIESNINSLLKRP
ncbi:TatD family hydrolase [Thalassotalea piscium]